MEVLVALALFTIISLVVAQLFISGMGYSKQSAERSAATTLGIQLMEQIRASPNPYTMVGLTPLARQERRLRIQLGAVPRGRSMVCRRGFRALGTPMP